MDRSKLSNVIATTRLLRHFSRVNLNTMKSYIYQELGCENESQFLCKILQSIYKTLSNQSITNIKNKAMEIADSQKIQSSLNINQQSNMTVYKYVQKQYNDRLSKLHSDIIDYLGTFLNKKQSIEFGYLNKQLYIETQKQSYLLKRCKDNVLRLDAKKIDKLFFGKHDAFNYILPQKLLLRLGANQRHMVKNMPFFEKFFYTLNDLYCANVFCLPYIPWKLLFNKRSNYYQRNECHDNMKRLRIYLPIYKDRHQEDKINIINQTCKNVITYKNSLGSDFESIWKEIRCIERLELILDCAYSNIKDYAKSLCKQFLIVFGTISKSICIENIDLTIDKIDEFESIFHSHMTHIHLNSFSQLNINLDNSNNNDKKNNNDDNNNDKSNGKAKGVKHNFLQNKKTGRLQHISVEACGDKKDRDRVFESLNNLDKYFMRRNVQIYSVVYRRIMFSHQPHNQLSVGSAQHVFDKIFFKDWDKHPLLKEISVSIIDNCYLFGLAGLLLYFNENFEKLFVNMKLYLKHFEKISIKYDRIYGKTVNGEHTTKIQLQVDTDGTIVANNKNSLILKQSVTKQYSVDANVIQIKDMKKGIKSFGQVFENVRHWLHAKQESLDQQGVNGSKIVFFVK